MNGIRRSLGVIARNSSAFGLRQPHLERTRLCELADEQLDARYVRQRAALRAHLAAMVKPKVVGGQARTCSCIRDCCKMGNDCSCKQWMRYHNGMHDAIYTCDICQ